MNYNPNKTAQLAQKIAQYMFTAKPVLKLMTRNVVEPWKCVFDTIQHHLTMRTEASSGKACHIVHKVR